MAISSKLKTVDGKRYATENYVEDKINESLNIDDITNKVIENSSDELTQIIKEDIKPEIESCAKKADVYTKTEVEEIINKNYSFNTL